jgi:hypothetical protein
MGQDVLPVPGWIKPKPFVALNHFTVPVAIVASPQKRRAIILGCWDCTIRRFAKAATGT